MAGPIIPDGRDEQSIPLVPELVPESPVDRAELPLGGRTDEPPQAVELSLCWRCHKEVPATESSCPYCEARLLAADRVVERIVAADATNPYVSATILVEKPDESLDSQAARGVIAVSRLVWFFLAILCVGVVEGLIAHSMSDRAEPNDIRNSELTSLIVAAEIADTLLIAAALINIPRPPKLVRRPSLAALGWVAGVPILAVMLLLNFGYHTLLRQYLHVPEGLLDRDIRGVTPAVAIALTCLQPAIVEELFFRYLAIGSLTNVTSLTGAIWISSVMFGMAHIGAPLSIPILMVVGVGLGYARCVSGSIVLPMIMHFVHNLIVMMVNGWI
jgi:membrane protease YdiL (CAAX protease family)